MRKWLYDFIAKKAVTISTNWFKSQRMEKSSVFVSGTSKSYLPTRAIIHT